MAEDLWLDVNAIAGLLAELFGAEMTTVDRRCSSCGRHHEVGAHRLYRGAGLVLRCPSCGDVAMRIAVVGQRRVLTLHGTWSLEVPSPGLYAVPG
jgi:predicted RNA-binding Zn-ribbon protein involved in translation (DUF1610 family)